MLAPHFSARSPSHVRRLWSEGRDSPTFQVPDSSLSRCGCRARRLAAWRKCGCDVAGGKQLQESVEGLSNVRRFVPIRCPNQPSFRVRPWSHLPPSLPPHLPFADKWLPGGTDRPPPNASNLAQAEHHSAHSSERQDGKRMCLHSSKERSVGGCQCFDVSSCAS